MPIKCMRYSFNFLYFQKLLVDVYHKIGKGRISKKEICADLKKSFPNWNIATDKACDEEVTVGDAYSEFISSFKLCSPIRSYARPSQV